MNHYECPNCESHWCGGCQSVKRAIYPRPNISNGSYQHYKGGTYDVFGLSRAEDTGVWHVLYRNTRTGDCFHRRACEWTDMMPGGVLRFRLV